MGYCGHVTVLKVQCPKTESKVEHGLHNSHPNHASDPPGCSDSIFTLDTFDEPPSPTATALPLCPETHVAALA